MSKPRSRGPARGVFLGHTSLFRARGSGGSPRLGKAPPQKRGTALVHPTFNLHVLIPPEQFFSVSLFIPPNQGR